MTKKQLELGAFALIGLAILGVWAWQTFKPQTLEVKEETMKTAAVREARITDETTQYKISVSYPEFYNSGDASREAAANGAIKSQVEKSIAAFKDYAREAEDFSPEIKSELEIKFRVVYLTASVASIQMSEYTYIEGAAHPLGNYWPFNYNFKDNKEIGLGDLFKSGSNYLVKLSQLSQESLKNELGESYDPSAVEFGTAPKSENFSVFVFNRDKLVIIFNPYAVAGYAAGSQTVEFSYEKLGEIISDEFLNLVRG